jgi:uncharacterized Ntn-hydrolase superfamily protein
MRFGRSPFRDVIERQLDLFVRDHSDTIDEVNERFRLYTSAGRADAEELYGDYLDAVESGTEILSDLRDHFARSLAEPDEERYLADFDRTVRRRLPRYALEIENR